MIRKVKGLTFCLSFPLSPLGLRLTFLEIDTLTKFKTICLLTQSVCFYLSWSILIVLDLDAVLRAICRNPDGQFWAGDTAQTISVGSSFRFDDLKAFLHRNEASRLHYKNLYTSS